MFSCKLIEIILGVDRQEKGMGAEIRFLSNFKEVVNRCKNPLIVKLIYLYECVVVFVYMHVFVCV